MNLVTDAMVTDAIARLRAKWSHDPLDRRDVEERLAVRLDPERETVVVEAPPACRIFVRRGEGWRSAYVHRLADVDAVLDGILARCA